MQSIGNKKKTSPWSSNVWAYTTSTEIAYGSEFADIPVFGPRQTQNDIASFSYVMCTNDMVIAFREEKVRQIVSGLAQWHSTQNLLGLKNLETKKAEERECTPEEKEHPETAGSIEMVALAYPDDLQENCDIYDDQLRGCVLTHPRVRNISVDNPIEKAQIWLKKTLKTEPFSKNTTCSELSSVVAHEGGHIFGILDIRYSLITSIMSYLYREINKRDSKICIPKLKDMTAIVALYQVSQEE